MTMSTRGTEAGVGSGWRWIRLLRVGLSFAYFGAGVWVGSRILLPLLRRTRWRGLSPEAVSVRTQGVVHQFCRSFVFCWTRVMRTARVQWVGAEKLGAGPQLLVANHPSLIDTPLLLTRLPQADFIVSQDWLRVGLLRPVIEATGYLHADSGATVVREATRRLRAGRTVVVYPEGSRSPEQGLRDFQRGAAHIALQTGCEIVPLAISVEPRALMQGQGWKDYPAKNPLFRVEVCDPIPPTTPQPGESRPVAARRLTGVLEEHFSKRWERGRS